MLKMQRPTNRSSSKQIRHRFDFKFSSFQALQVPKGWDRLFVSLVSAETGKTIAKLGKALVKNGSCLWSETVSESIYILRYDSSKSYEECLVKFVVSTGSTRSANTLGEAIINMAQHTSSRASAAVSQPLKKCSYGTIFQVKIQRVNLPRSRIRDEESKNSDSQEKVEDVDHFGAGSKSRRSDNSSEDPATSSRPLQLDTEEASESATVVINSISSMEGSYERENSFVEKDSRSDEYRSHERRGRGSYGGGLLPEFYSVDDDGGGGGYDDSPSNQSPMHLRENFHNEAAGSRWSMSNVGSSRNLLEAAEDTIEELRAEAKMWERNARKLMIDVDISRKEFSDLSKKQAESEVELSAAYAEQDGLRRQVKTVMEELQQLAKNEANRKTPIIQSQSLQKELESEIKYQQDLNYDLCQQLKQSQESNIELVSVLQELEETIEQQRIEMEKLSSLKLNFADLQNSLDQSSEENRTLLLQLEQLRESEKKLKSDIQLLDEALRDKTGELEKERESNRRILSQVEGEYYCKILAKEKEIASLEGKLSDYIKDEELKGSAEKDVDLIREIESLREKVRELEKDCT
ncbi:nuclear-pore anchor-like isoform X2 [Salvia miltiorrhiza]|uniref:nuclear-pore anchor-like isoform X2 n=1 Tax=Salvia miltiorrhiza TaxID=226208 RepID=UPI0025AD79D3|nr:nuclear-pore anchor-like isoform X2 [Salvia miltiorrhiza]